MAGSSTVPERAAKVPMNTAYCRWGKRALDVAASALTLVALSPVLAAVALLVRTKLGSPVFFRQQRPGMRGEPFTVLKFRTMTAATDQSGRLLPDQARLTRFGRALRSASLDELPEFWNVLRGDMSLVGPRPLLMQYLPRYSPEQARRHEVRPGITGLAQVDGRNQVSWEERFRLDVEYVDQVSVGLDLRILLRTLMLVIARKGISAEGFATMPEFMGQAAHAGDVRRVQPGPAGAQEGSR
jgi:lipopolysaccharide/colanic/teichoic acid biosynthesis glycosyltransferase